MAILEFLEKQRMKEINNLILLNLNIAYACCFLNKLKENYILIISNYHNHKYQKKLLKTCIYFLCNSSIRINIFSFTLKTDSFRQRKQLNMEPYRFTLYNVK